MKTFFERIKAFFSSLFQSVLFVPLFFASLLYFLWVVFRDSFKNNKEDASSSSRQDEGNVVREVLKQEQEAAQRKEEIERELERKNSDLDQEARQKIIQREEGRQLRIKRWADIKDRGRSEDLVRELEQELDREIGLDEEGDKKKPADGGYVQ